MFDLSKYYIEVGGKKGTYFKRKTYFQLNDPELHSKVARFFDKYGDDSYMCVYAYENINDLDNCKIYGDLYFDLDGDIHSETGYKKLRSNVTILVSYFKSIGLNDDEIEIYFSGAKGFHILIPAKVLGIEPSTNLNQLYKSWALYLKNTYKVDTIDIVIYDRKRLLRIKNTTNSKTGLKKTRIDLDTLWSADNYIDFIKLIANRNLSNLNSKQDINIPAARYFYTKSQNFYRKCDMNTNHTLIVLPEEKKELLPCIKHGLESGAGVGSRNNTLVVLASGVLQSGYKLEEVLDIMHYWNENNNEEPLAFNEIEMTVRSAYSMLLGGKRYGCSAIKELGLCPDGNCPLEERK